MSGLVGGYVEWSGFFPPEHDVSSEGKVFLLNKEDLL